MYIVIIKAIHLSRWQEWHSSKLPYLGAVGLLLAPSDASVVFMVALLLTVAGVAAFGYAVNDVADVVDDYRSGKPNRAAELPAKLIVVLLLLMAVWAIALSFAWAANIVGTVLIAVTVVLAAAYSMRPFRLKERGVFGIITGASAQWVMPVFALSMSQPDGWRQPAVWLLAALGFAIGLRYMCVHQLSDASADQRAMVRTYATTGGKVHRLIIGAFAAEGALLVGVLTILWPLSFPAVLALAPWGIQELLFGFKRGQIFKRLQSYDYAPLAEYYFFLLPVALAIGRATYSLSYLLVICVFLILGWCYLQMIVGEWLSLLKKGSAIL